MEKAAPGWSRHLNETYNAYYWSNSVTNETWWEEEVLNDPVRKAQIFPPSNSSAHGKSSSGHGFSINSGTSDKQKHNETKSQPSKRVFNPMVLLESIEEKKVERILEYDTMKKNDESNDVPLTKSAKFWKKAQQLEMIHLGLKPDGRKYVTDDYDDGLDSSDEESNVKGDIQEEKNENDQLIDVSPVVKSVYEKTRSDVIWYSRFLFCNACFVEAPLGAIEGIIRFFAFVVVGILQILLNCFLFLCSRRHRRTLSIKEIIFSAIPSFKESAKSLAASFSLLVPCIAPCFVYRLYDLDEEWDLAPIPTVLGWVDARRFVTFTFGGGFLARNVSPVYTTMKHTNNEANGDSGSDSGNFDLENDYDQAKEEKEKQHHQQQQQIVKDGDANANANKLGHAQSQSPWIQSNTRHGSMGNNNNKVSLKSIYGIIDDDCQDSFGDRVIGSPRVISYSLGRIIRGDDVEEL